MALVEAGWRLGDRLLVLAAPQLRGDDIAELQDSLNQLGFDCGRPDGIFGPATMRALEDFQRNGGLTPDGSADRVPSGPSNSCAARPAPVRVSHRCARPS
jgi:peptidoglycan hydrolase-like protein with peptidoglycan-binding domain